MANSRAYQIFDEALRKEADQVLYEQGLHDLLAEFGKVHLVGSYVMRLMVWRDLDIFLERSPDLQSSLELGRRVAMLLSPYKMFLTDYCAGPREFGFEGQYWGIRLGDLSSGAWKIDLHIEGSNCCRHAVEACERTMSRLDNRSRLSILAIKTKLCQDPEYRKSIISQGVYDAVLDGKVDSLSTFWSYIQERNVLHGKNPA